jgi:hypothetical protein
MTDWIDEVVAGSAPIFPGYEVRREDDEVEGACFSIWGAGLSSASRGAVKHARDVDVRVLPMVIGRQPSRQEVRG